MPERAVASPVAVALLLLVVVAAAGLLGAAGLRVADTPPAPEPVAIDASVSPSGTVVVTHRAGPTLDVRDLDVRVSVDGTPLDRQPPVPFFSARGFGPGPTGPFNSASDPRWSAGESASFRIAGTNDPPVTPGATVVIALLYRDQPTGRATATVRAGSTGNRDVGVPAGLDRPPP